MTNSVYNSKRQAPVEDLVFLSNSPAATLSLGKRLGERLGAGTVIALIGELGSGKTLLTRGICAGLGVPDRRVNSPTFVLVNEYSGRLPVFHMDLYRLGSEAEALEIGVLDYLARGERGIILVEWAEKIISILPAERLEIHFEVLGARKRRITLFASGKKYASLLKELDQA